MKKMGDIILLENKNELNKMEFMFANTNSIDDCISNYYVEETQTMYVKEFMFSGFCSRNRVQLIEDI
jgi:hypothetical protein